MHKKSKLPSAPLTSSSGAVRLLAERQRRKACARAGGEGSSFSRAGRHGAIRNLPTGLALVVIASLHAAAEEAGFDRETWFAAAEARIAKHRQGELVLTLVDNDREPVAGTAVRIKQTRHAFPFGTAISGELILAAKPGDTYRERILENFNTVTIENAQKWPLWECPEWRARAEAAVDWARRHELLVRGHCMVWQTTQFGKPMPRHEWLEVLAAEAGEPADLARVERRIRDHIADIGGHYRGRVAHWDVTNEITEHHKALAVLTPGEDPLTSSKIAHWYRLAHRAAPDAELLVNDYGILSGKKEAQKAGYEATIRSLVEDGAPLHGIGMQCHNWTWWTRRNPEQITTTLDRFARFGLPIWITEFDTPGKGWGEERAEREPKQAEYLREHLTACFAHPAVGGYVMWGFWDGKHWSDDAPLFREDWSEKPAYAVWRELVFDRWWSDETVTTDDAGVLRVRLFKGKHRLTLEHAGREWSFTVVVRDSEVRTRIRLKE